MKLNATFAALDEVRESKVKTSPMSGCVQTNGIEVESCDAFAGVQTKRNLIHKVELVS